jgi:hypothetical protein
MTRATTVPPDSGSGLGGAGPSRLGRAATHGGAPAGSSSATTGSVSEDACRTAWYSLAAWLRAGRLDRGMSIADIARTTKIQARILEDLEAGETDGLPADVFVRGFVRNYARCVGLSEAEALARYAACSRDAGPVASPAATAVAELYAPTSRRMSTVVPVAPGSPAAEVHAQGHRYERAATSPGYSIPAIQAVPARAATSPGLSQPRVLRATTQNGEAVEVAGPGAPGAPGAYGARRTSTQMAVVYPRPVVGSGLVTTAGAQAAIAAAAAESSMAGTAASTPPVIAVVEVAEVGPAGTVAPAARLAVEPARTLAPEWPRGLTAKKRKSQKRKERNARNELNELNRRQANEANVLPVARQRAQTIRPPIEEEIFESEQAAQRVAPPAAVVIETPPVATVATVAIGPAAIVAVEGWPGAGAPAAAPAAATAALEVAEAAPVAELEAAAEPDLQPAEVWIPKMPPAPRSSSVSRSFVSPTLTIDDSDPESASREQDDRSHERSHDREGRDPTRRTFLPPILLESQDHANRQGGLTLAVIILLIAATLTLSYLMRRPSSGGGGMTSLDAPVTLLG